MPAPPVSATVTSPSLASYGLPVPYAPMGVPEGVAVVTPPEAAEEIVEEGVGLGTLLEWFNAYQDVKQPEMNEQREARRYYHGVQWTDDELRVLADRKQPPNTTNLIAQQINGIVGAIGKLRQDPKAYPRNEDHAEGAELGTAAVREILDENQWEDLDDEVLLDLAIDGIGGVEKDIEADSDAGPNLVWRSVAPETFFYDPRSVKADFSDARYMGVYKWMDLDAAIEMMPDREEDLESAIDRTDATSSGLLDWDKLWYDARLKRVKIVECWYKRRGEWRGAIFTGDLILADIVSPFRDEKGKTACRYHMASAGVDHEGTRYGFVRNLKSPQDETNHRRSKLLHLMNVSQVVYEDGAVDDINQTREELAKPDGVIKLNPGTVGNKKFDIRDQTAQMQGQAELLQEAKATIQNFGPGPALLGNAPASQSGRAMQIQMQAAIAQLGPMFKRYKSFKLGVYRDSWSFAKAAWTNPRVIRVLGEDDVKFIPVNQMVMTPEGPRIANAIPRLDLEVKLDEGPDVNTLREDVMLTFKALVDQKLVPQQAALPMMVELSDLPPSVKTKLLGLGQQPDPQAQAEQQMAKQLQVAGAQATIREKTARADQLQADAIHKVAQARNSGALVQEHAVHTAEAMANLEHKAAQTRKVQAEADAAHLSNAATLGDGLAAMGAQPRVVPQIPLGQQYAPQPQPPGF